MRIIKFISAILIYLMAASSVHAGWDSYTTANVNMREGPGSWYRIVVTVPAGEPVYVHGCLEDRPWCEAEWKWYRGFIYDRYLEDSAYLYTPDYVVPPAIIYDPYDYPDYIYIPRHRHKKRYVPPKRKKRKAYMKKRKKKMKHKPRMRKKKKKVKMAPMRKKRKVVMQKKRRKVVQRKKQLQPSGMRKKRRR